MTGSTAPATAPAPAARRSRGGPRSLYAGNARSVLSRGLLATRSTNWTVVLSGFFEPVFYLLAMGIGLGSLVGDVTTSTGQPVPTPPTSRPRSSRSPR